MDIITQRMSIGEAAKRFDAQSHKNYENVDILGICKAHGIEEKDAEYVVKGLTPDDLEFIDGERAVISVITTGTVDRDKEIVDPAGAILDDYNETPVVLFGHDHHGLPIGKNDWIKIDANNNLIAKTTYYSRGFADDVFQYRKEGFPLAQSIGFIPVETKSGNELSKEEKDAGVRRKFTKWILLEYSDVPIPSNPEAVAIAVSKSLIKSEESADYGVETIPALKDNWEELFKSGETITIVDVEDKETIIVTDGLGEKEVDFFHNESELIDYEVVGDSDEKGSGEPQKKTADLDGNPSVGDIREAIRNTLRSVITLPGQPTFYSYIVDLYPVDYPNGHCIIEIESKEGDKFYQYDYTYADGVAVLSEEFTELEQGYKPKHFEDAELKAGAVLSRKNRSIVNKAITGMNVATSSLQALMVATDTGKSLEPADGIEIKDSEDLITIPDSLFEPAEEKDTDGDKITIDKSDLQNLLMTTMKDVLTRNRTQKAKDTVDAVKAGIDKAKGKV